MGTEDTVATTQEAFSQLSEALKALDESGVFKALSAPETIAATQKAVEELSMLGKASTALGLASIGLEIGLSIAGVDEPAYGESRYTCIRSVPDELFTPPGRVRQTLTNHCNNRRNLMPVFEVTFHKLEVLKIDDGYFGGDKLETIFTFSVNNQHQKWKKNVKIGSYDKGTGPFLRLVEERFGESSYQSTGN